MTNTSGTGRHHNLPISTAKILWFSDRLYRLLLYFYPTAFRREFGREMAQVFRDDAQQTYSDGGFRQLLSLWLNVFIDFNRTVLAEHIWEIRHRSSIKYVRWSGVAVTCGGIIWLMPWFLPWTGWFNEISETAQLQASLVGLILVASGVVGLYLHLKTGGSWVSTLAFVLAFGGLVLVIAPVVFVLVHGPTPDREPFQLVITGVICFMLGLMLMGSIIVSRRTLGVLSFVPLVLAASYFVIVILLVFSAIVPQTRFLIPIFLTLNLLCWPLIGVAVWFKTRKELKRLV